jgi:redox-sensitive bicupin YhaK (pirin superfamily)
MGSQAVSEGRPRRSFVTLASGLPEDADALPIRTPARVAGATVRAGETVTYQLGEGRHLYLVPATGAIEVNGVPCQCARRRGGA